MHSGKGSLVLRDGRRLPVMFQFASDYGDTRAGYLLCDTSALDPAMLLERLRICCDGGPEIIAAVTHSSDRYLAVTGRILRLTA